MNKELLQEQADFLEFIKSYEYINSDGRLDLEAFCVNLSICFSCDGIMEKSPDPRKAYDLLIDILRYYAKDDEMSLWVQRQNLVDWSPQIGHIYPDKYRTYIHVAGLVHAVRDWIYGIGRELMGVPRPETIPKYFWWVQNEWVFVGAFIKGFHTWFSEYLKRFDMRISADTGYSLFEALHLSDGNSSFDEVVSKLKIRSAAQDAAINRIDEAMDAGFCLEAITLQECLISNCLFNYLEARGAKGAGLSFVKLIASVRESSDDELLLEVDRWRLNRNRAIHGFVESKAEELSKSVDSFGLLSIETARKGRDLCRSVLIWYLRESVNFLATEFPSADKKVH